MAAAPEMMVSPGPLTRQIFSKAVNSMLLTDAGAITRGDGIGDLPGLFSRLDYLQDLGIDAIWLSPYYPSPQVDCGYDIATSDQHNWFQQSHSGKGNPYRDWYVWHPGVDGDPPNNWYSAFGGSAWEYDPGSGEYYYHLFFKEQPDLNWREPAVKEAMWGAARFWLDMGVDGFRLDAIDTLFEHPDLPDHPVQDSQSDLRHYLLSANSEQREEHGDQSRLFQYQVDQPGVVGATHNTPHPTIFRLSSLMSFKHFGLFKRLK